MQLHIGCTRALNPKILAELVVGCLLERFGHGKTRSIGVCAELLLVGTLEELGRACKCDSGSTERGMQITRPHGLRTPPPTTPKSLVSTPPPTTP